MPRGGKRQGTPGKAYANRTDLGMNYMPGDAAAGGMVPMPQQQPIMPPTIGADQVPNIGDPTMRPNEPITAGIPYGPGPGAEALGPMPPNPADPVRLAVQAMMLTTPNADLVRLLNRFQYEGR